MKELTKEQIAKLAEYRDDAIRVGLDATEEPMNVELVRELTDAHRQIFNIPKATNFIVVDSPKQAIELYGKRCSTLTPANALYGQHDVNWLWSYKYYNEVLGHTEHIDKVRFLIELCYHVNWMWMSSNTTIAVRKPVEAHTVIRKRRFTDHDWNESTFDCPTLHNTEGMALKYADGFGLYKLNNIDFFKPETIKLIETAADKINPQDVLNVRNTEQRTELIKKIGMDRVFSSMEKNELHSKTFDIGGTYKLYEMEFSGGRRVYLQGECPSKGEIFLERVPPTCKTVDQALQWREDWALRRVVDDTIRDITHKYVEPKVQS